MKISGLTCRRASISHRGVEYFELICIFEENKKSGHKIQDEID